MQPHLLDHILLTHPPEVAVVANVSTFELSSFPAFRKFYWEIALATCRGHGKYFAGTALSPHVSTTVLLHVELPRWGLSPILCVLLISHAAVKANQSFWGKKNGGSLWQDGISHQLWSQRWCQLPDFHWLESLKNGGVSFQSPFL